MPKKKWGELQPAGNESYRQACDVTVGLELRVDVTPLAQIWIKIAKISPLGKDALELTLVDKRKIVCQREASLFTRR